MRAKRISGGNTPLRKKRSGEIDAWQQANRRYFINA